LVVEVSRLDEYGLPAYDQDLVDRMIQSRVDAGRPYLAGNPPGVTHYCTMRWSEIHGHDRTAPLCGTPVPGVRLANHWRIVNCDACRAAASDAGR
jgi:hypothetical protein